MDQARYAEQNVLPAMDLYGSKLQAAREFLALLQQFRRQGMKDCLEAEEASSLKAVSLSHLSIGCSADLKEDVKGLLLRSKILTVAKIAQDLEAALADLFDESNRWAGAVGDMLKLVGVDIIGETPALETSVTEA